LEGKKSARQKLHGNKKLQVKIGLQPKVACILPIFFK
jgi:hypothetical protein